MISAFGLGSVASFAPECAQTSSSSSTSAFHALSKRFPSSLHPNPAISPTEAKLYKYTVRPPVCDADTSWADKDKRLTRRARGLRLCHPQLRAQVRPECAGRVRSSIGA